MTAPESRDTYPGPRFDTFVDASGDPNLDVDKAGVSKFFVVAAVLVPGASTAQVASSVDAIRAEYFGPGEMKSSSVGGNLDRRLRVLGSLTQVDLRLVALAVDKSEISGNSGLVYKQPFLKFLHRQLFQRLYRAHPDLNLVCDETGSAAFMAGFRSYVEENGSPDLFCRPRFAFADSAHHPLLQAADFFGGTLRRIFEGGDGAASAQVIALIKPRVLSVREWPPRSRALPELEEFASDHDDAVREYCLRQIENFTAQHEGTEDNDIGSQVATLDYLLFHFNSISERDFVATEAIRNALAGAGFRSPNEQHFRSRVIARLRDQEVILSSSSRGYKIPSTVRDVMAYVRLGDNMVHPMVHRLQRARDALKLLTGGSLDILGAEQFAYLRRAAEEPIPAPTQDVELEADA